MDKEVKEALALLRSKGLRIPRSLTTRIKTRGFAPTRSDLKKLKEWITGMEHGDHLVVGISQRGTLVITNYEAYNNLVKNAAAARAKIPQTAVAV